MTREEDGGNFVRDNSLCVNGDVFNTKSRIIRYLANPEKDNDAVNKLHLDHRFKTIIKDMDDCVNRNRILCENYKRKVLSRLGEF